jgi:hypothetical protein
MAITARFAAFLKPTSEELEKWHVACEGTGEVEGRMRRYVSAATLTDQPISVA